jgi:AcrR family transcriptional regulator
MRLPEEHLSVRGNASGRFTRELLIVTAERLFAERSIHGVSMREIGIAAGQRNNNVVTYHFGDRDGLVGAIYAFRSEQLNSRRLELIDELDAQGKGNELYSLLRAVLQPHAETIPDASNHFLGLLARLLLDEGSLAGQGAAASSFLSAHDLLRTRIRAHVPHLRPAAFRRRYDQLFNFAVVTLAVRKRQAGERATPVIDVLNELITTIAAALVAPAKPS